MELSWKKQSDFDLKFIERCGGHRQQNIPYSKYMVVQLYDEYQTPGPTG